jgi:hypothetical protein
MPVPRHARRTDAKAASNPATEFDASLAVLVLLVALLAGFLSGAVDGLQRWRIPKGFRDGRGLRALLVRESPGDADALLIGMAIRDAASPDVPREVVVPLLRGDVLPQIRGDQKWWFVVFTRNIGEMSRGRLVRATYDPVLPMSSIDYLRDRYEVRRYSAEVYIVGGPAIRGDGRYVIHTDPTGSQVWVLPGPISPLRNSP